MWPIALSLGDMEICHMESLFLSMLNSFLHCPHDKIPCLVVFVVVVVVVS